MRETLRAYCIRTGKRDLLHQWDFERNGSETPQTVSYGSAKKVWWRCDKGHAWQASVYSRTGSETGCPFCTGKKPVEGETDLATCFPYLAAQWHPTRNLPLLPGQVLPGSHRKVWWVCGRGHTWKAQIKSRVAGSGCPVCSNREVRSGSNDLTSQFPELAKQWHPARNGTLSPEQVAPGSHRKVWWVCEKGHVWRASVVSRTSAGCGCPVCSGKQVLAGENDLASNFPQIAAEWHPEKNGTLTAAQVTASSNRKVWWRCAKGHAYAAVVSTRVSRGSGCPYCAGRKALPDFNDLATVEPKVAAQWHPTLNGTLTPAQVTYGSRKKVWWQCPEGHVWKAAIYARAGPQKSGCPVCAGRFKTQRLYPSIPAPPETAKLRTTAFEKPSEIE